MWRSVKNIIKVFRFKKEKFLKDAIKELPASDGVTLVDVGAAGGIQPRWKVIESNLNYIGFEPDDRSRHELDRSNHEFRSYEVHPHALWNKPGMLSINLCRKAQVSSHFTPNYQFLSLFAESERFEVVATERLEARKLDQLGIKAADFIKLDIQGGELSVLEGAECLLESAFGLEVEVEFLPLYVNQPLFGEITSFLSRVGFEFVDFVNLGRWERKAYNGFGQCVYGDALFLRTPEGMIRENQSLDLISRYLTICLLYNRFELIERTISLLSVENAKKFSGFIKCLGPVKNNNRRARILSQFTNSLLTLCGTEYRSHLIY